MKIRENPIISNKENCPTPIKGILQKPLTMSLNNSEKALIHLNKNTETDHKFAKKTNKENIPAIKEKETEEQNRKTIENTIKDLLKDEQDLFNYLESEKEFISILETHDPNLKHLAKQRGKLTSSLTEKKKSRIDTHSKTKSKLISNLKNLPEYLTQNNKNSNKKIKNSAVTVELVNSKEQIKISSEPYQIETKHYETISFDNINTEINQKPSEKILIKNTLTEENEPPKYCLVLTSPQKKKSNQVKEKKEHNFNTTKYGLAHFSPWAFPKDSKHNDFDMIEMNSHENSFDNETFYKEYTDKNENQRNLKSYEDNASEKSKKMQFLSRSFQTKRKISTDSHSKQSIRKNQYVSSFHEIFEKKEEYKEIVPIENERRKEQLEQNDLKEMTVLKILEPNKTKIANLIKQENRVNIVKSSQVIILNSQPGKISEMFAPKSSLKNHMHPKRTSNKDFSFESNDKKIFHTELEEEDFTQGREKMKTIVQNDDLLQEESELIELKKTEEFLREIMIGKSNISYPNNNTIQTISKKQFTKVNKISDEKDENKIKSMSAKQSAEMRFKTYNHLKSECVFLDTAINFNHEKNEKSILKEYQSNNKNCESDKENALSSGEEVYYKKAKTSLDKPLHENEVYQLISSSNTKYLTEANLSGFYMINDSKIRNEKSAFVRKKRHSTMVMKNRKNSQSTQSKGEVEKKRYSFSMEKDLLNRSEMSLLQEGKGFGIINPLTKQLYRKYVSIVQKRN